MKIATIAELKQELLHEPPAKLMELCLRLARFKKENKELLTYLLFEANDVDVYIQGIKKEMAGHFETINVSNVYFVKKTVRKILRITNKYIRYSGSGIVEVSLLIHFCALIKSLGPVINENVVISNIFQNQVKRITKSIAAMHEDLQYDFLKELKELYE